MDGKETEAFEAVWKRVNSSKDGGGSDEIIALRMLIDAKATGIYLYGKTVKALTPSKQRYLLTLKGEETSQLKRLQTMHLILVGDTYAPKRDKTRENSIFELLRSAYLYEEDCSKKLRAAWDKCNNQRLSEMYADMEQEDRAHLRKIERIIGELIS